MGVPKFFRWISERYPLCSQLVQENRIPEFDNLYLDMNGPSFFVNMDSSNFLGIIHTCSHGNDTDTDIHARTPEHQIFSQIFTYIDHLFATIRPRRVFFLAVDGVAPRAKMNQQRSRRFRTAAEAAESVRKAEKKGVESAEGQAFDSNCITPGTEFMERLSQQLHYYITKKLNDDMDWRGCTVILSGHEVPGEGEHKIMEYIRLSRSQPDYDPNTRHCLYGLDADLMMLGLLSHDPHFCLLREQVQFGPQKKTSTQESHSISPDNQRFFLMHLSLLREYLLKEFQCLSKPGALPFEYHSECIIDDFVLMAVFVGNDFLPHLPGLHINEGALALMFEAYKNLLPTMGGYMNEGGQVNFNRVEIILNSLTSVEESQFEDEVLIGNNDSTSHIHTRRNKSSSNGAPKVLSRTEKQIVDSLKVFCTVHIKELHLSHALSVDERKFAVKLASELGLFSATLGELDDKHVVFSRNLPRTDSADDTDTDIDAVETEEEEEEDEESILARERIFKKYERASVVDTAGVDAAEAKRLKLEEDKIAWKTSYYREKLEFAYSNTEKLNQLRGFYLQGIQWVMHYYYRGVQSWSWFFPYHYAPKISDLFPGTAGFVEAMPPLEMGKPFKPFEQLMGVLPVRSQVLLPEAYRELMHGAGSLILDFYPLDFETDLNGKKNDWEAIVKIPFIEEKRLLTAMKTREHMTSASEKRRNTFGFSYKFQYNETDHGVLFKSPLPNVFPDISNCHVVRTEYVLPIVEGHFGGDDGLVKGYLPGAKRGRDMKAGFPSLDTIEHTSALKKHGVKVFNTESRNNSVIVSLTAPAIKESHNLDTLARNKIGKHVYVGWPFLVEALVVAVSDAYFVRTADPPLANPLILRRDTAPTLQSILKLPQDPFTMQKWEKMASDIETEYSMRYGILFGNVECLIHVCILRGMKRLANGAIKKDFGDIKDAKEFPLQSVVEIVACDDERYIEQEAPKLEIEYPLGMKGFYLGVDGGIYGCECVVTGYGNDGRSLTLNITQSADDTVSRSAGISIARDSAKSETYITANSIAKNLAISQTALSRITASLFVLGAGGEKSNIGLGIKFEGRQQKVLGYSRRHDNGQWEYSSAALELLQEYKTLYPQVFVQGGKKSDFLQANELFGAGGHEKVAEIRKWLKSKGVWDFQQVALEVNMMSKEYIGVLEKLVDERALRVSTLLLFSSYIKKPTTASVELKNVPSTLVLIPSQAKYRLSYAQKFAVGDQLRFIPNTSSVPTGAQGYVVGIENPQLTADLRATTQTTQIKKHQWVYVLFDQPFLGAGDLDGKCSDKRGVVLSSECLLNLTNAQPPLSFASKKLLSKAPITVAKRRPFTSEPARTKNLSSEELTPSVAEFMRAASKMTTSVPHVWEKRTEKQSLVKILNRPDSYAPAFGSSKSTDTLPTQAPKYDWRSLAAAPVFVPSTTASSAAFVKTTKSPNKQHIDPLANKKKAQAAVTDSGVDWRALVAPINSSAATAGKVKYAAVAKVKKPSAKVPIAPVLAASDGADSTEKLLKLMLNIK